MSHRTLVALFAVVAVCLAAGCAHETGAPSAAEAPEGAQGTVALASASGAADPATVERGRYLVTIGQCHDCHTPLKLGPNGPEPDMARMLSGHPETLVMPEPPTTPSPWGWAGADTLTAFAGPWGISYATNLTPHPSGLAAWDEEIFVAAMRTGKHMGQSRPILPPMPWMNVAQMTDEDLRAVFAYLRSIPPIENRVPEPVIAPPPPGVASGAAAPADAAPGTVGG